MTAALPKITIQDMILEYDRKNLEGINHAEKSGRINHEAADYLRSMYSDGMYWFRQVFYVLGECFGAPKAAIMEYDAVTGQTIDHTIKISDINPMSAYMVHHRLDADPMRNQFFTADDTSQKIDLSVSSIVSVIVGAQKKIERTLDKITGKYYDDYVNNVISSVVEVFEKNNSDIDINEVTLKIRETFYDKYITNASETVLSVIDVPNESVAVELVRTLDQVTKPHLRLRDVWRVKCLFDLVPQVRTFIDRIHDVSPNMIIAVKDKFFKTDSPRNYRDAKIILNIGNGVVVPMEIICQVRTFFDYEKGTHDIYERGRRDKNLTDESVAHKIAIYHEDGVRQYNAMICRCLDDLFERVGWNILYSNRSGESMFDGFPKLSKPPYPSRVVDAILEKLDNGVGNEVFKIENAPRPLSIAEEMEIFQWMAKFVMISAVPYMDWNWRVPGDNQATKFFNFIMNELSRYY